MSKRAVRFDRRFADDEDIPVILPPPDVLREYENISPGISTKLIEAVEAERAHRHRANERIIQSEIRLSRESILWSVAIKAVAILGITASAIAWGFLSFRVAGPVSAAVRVVALSVTLAAYLVFFLSVRRANAIRHSTDHRLTWPENH